jgi:hypothetical protein
MPSDTVNRKWALVAWAIAGACLSALAVDAPGGQAEPGRPQHKMRTMGTAPDGCSDATLRCAIAGTPTFSADGALWLVWAAGGRVSVAKSTDLGRHFLTPVAVSPERVTLDSGPDERPQIVVDRAGRIVVAYAVFTDENYNGRVFTAVSTDGGARFSTPRTITPDGSSQRFINLVLDRDGRIFASWIDKRNVAAARAVGKAFAGASLAFAWSSDGGATFATTRIAHDNTCECCRLGVALAGPGRPAILFRNIFDGERDHAVLTFNRDMTPGPLVRVAEDHWKIDACPDHGPSLAIGRDGIYYAVWFSGGGVRQGSFYARSVDGGRTFSPPQRLGAAERQATRPYVVALNRTVWLAWKEFDGEQTTTLTAVSRDAGRSWTAPHIVAHTKDFSDHPLLVSDGRDVYLSWVTRAEGYRLVKLEPSS